MILTEKDKRAIISLCTNEMRTGSARNFQHLGQLRRKMEQSLKPDNTVNCSDDSITRIVYTKK